MPLTRAIYPPANYKVLDVNGDAAFNGESRFGNAPVLPISTSSIPSLRIPHGSNPLTLQNGDIWTTTFGIFTRIDGETINLSRPESFSFFNQVANTLQLTANSNKHQFVRTGFGAGSQIIRLPDTSTLKIGQSFIITNSSNASQLSVASFTGASIRIVPTGNSSWEFTCIDTTSNFASSWSAKFIATDDVTGYAAGSNLVFSNSPAIDGIAATTTSSNGSLWNNVQVGTLTIGGGLTTGPLNLAISSSFNGTVSIATGAGTVGKTVNIGTSSTSGTTSIAIGSISGATSNVTIFGIADGTTTTATRGAGYMGMPQRSTSTSGSFSAADAGRHVYVTATGTTQTIPANGTEALPIGTTIVVVNGNGVSTSIAINTDTLRLAGSTSTGTRTLASNGMCTLLKINSTEWIASGNGLT